MEKPPFLSGCGEMTILNILRLLTGCGTQHPLRASCGTRVLLAAAQQLLPVSATGGGRRRCWILSAEELFIISRLERPRLRSVAMKAPVGLLSGRAVCVSRWRGFAPTSSAERSKRIFTGGVVKVNGSCRAGFLRKQLRGGYPLYLLCARLSLPSMMSFAAASRSG